MSDDPIGTAQVLAKLYGIKCVIHRTKHRTRPYWLRIGEPEWFFVRSYRGGIGYSRLRYPKTMTFTNSENLLTGVKRLIADRNPYE